MPCGGIYPAADRRPCWHCGDHGADHFLEEYDAYIHGLCVRPFLRYGIEGRIVLDHEHDVVVVSPDGQLLLEYENGNLIFDAEEPEA